MEFSIGESVMIDPDATVYYLPNGQKCLLQNKPEYRNFIWMVISGIEYSNMRLYRLRHNNTFIDVKQHNVKKIEEKSYNKLSNFLVGDSVKFTANATFYYSPEGKIFLSSTSPYRNFVWEFLGRKVLSTNSGEVKVCCIKCMGNIICAEPSQIEKVSKPIEKQTEKSNEIIADGGYKFTALGLSGAGKTCFMAGMYYKMTGGYEGYTLKASDDDDVKLTTMYEKMKNSRAGIDRFPIGTNQTTRHSFELQYQYDTIEKFEWIDYDGNALKLKNSGNAKQYQELKKDISQSEILYIFVDGGLFDDEELKYTENERDKVELLSDIVIDSCSRQVNHFISEYAKENHKIPPIAIVVTKYDIVNEILGKSTSKETMELIDKIIKRAFNPLFPDPTVYNSNPSYVSMVGIIPVSLGVTIAQDDYKGRLRPINMHLPVYMGVWFMLKKSCDYLRNNNLVTNEKYKTVLLKQESAMNKLSHELEECGSKFYINGQTGKFTELANAYFELQKEKV